MNPKVRIIMLKGAKGDSGNSGDYQGLLHKPQINGVTLDGNKTPSNLGLMTQTEAEEIQASVENLGSTIQSLSLELLNLRQDLETYYATEQYVNDAIDAAITQAINEEY